MLGRTDDLIQVGRPVVDASPRLALTVLLRKKLSDNPFEARCDAIDPSATAVKQVSALHSGQCNSMTTAGTPLPEPPPPATEPQPRTTDAERHQAATGGQSEDRPSDAADLRD